MFPHHCFSQLLWWKSYIRNVILTTLNAALQICKAFFTTQTHLCKRHFIKHFHRRFKTSKQVFLFCHFSQNLTYFGKSTAKNVGLMSQGAKGLYETGLKCWTTCGDGWVCFTQIFIWHKNTELYLTWDSWQENVAWWPKVAWWSRGREEKGVSGFTDFSRCGWILKRSMAYVAGGVGGTLRGVGEGPAELNRFKMCWPELQGILWEAVGRGQQVWYWNPSQETEHETAVSMAECIDLGKEHEAW